MIYCHIKGRLGNQLFRYAFARRISLATGQEIAFDFSDNESVGWKNDLEDFACVGLKPDGEVPPIPRKLKLRLDFYRILRNIRLKFVSKERWRIEDDRISLAYAAKLAKHGIFFIEEGYYPFDSFDFPDIVLHGMFESRRYFDDIRDRLREEIAPKAPLDANTPVIERMNACESVCITIRRGDFLDPEIAKTHLVCDIDYYQRAIDEIKARVENPVFFVFSDDIEWVKNNLDFPEGSYFESGRDTVAEKIRLMRECKHYILSNSTFSWWCWYLSHMQEGQVVISPDKWSRCEHITDLIDPTWILIETR